MFEGACGNGALHLSTAGLYHGSSPCQCSQQFMHNVAMSTIGRKGNWWYIYIQCVLYPASWEATPSAHSDPREYYLGLLSFTEDHKMYPSRFCVSNIDYLCIETMHF